MKVFIIWLACLSLGICSDVYATFSVNADKDVKLAIDSGGIVSSIEVDVGSVVKKDQVLLRLDNKDKLESLNIQKAKAQGVEAQYLFAEKQYKRFKQSGGAVDKNTLEQQYSNYKQLESAFLQSKHSIKLQEEIVKRGTLVAPFDGVIASKNTEVGAGVAPNSTVLFRIIGHKRKMLVEFDSKYAGIVKVGSVFVYNINGEKSGSTTIDKIYPIVEEGTRKMKAEAVAPDSMLPGLFGDGYIEAK